MKRKTHNEIAVICRDALIEKKINIKKLPVVPWDHIVYTFCEGLDGTELGKKRIANMFIAVVRIEPKNTSDIKSERKRTYCR